MTMENEYQRVRKRLPIPEVHEPREEFCTCPTCEKQLSQEELLKKICSSCKEVFKTNIHGEPIIITYE